MQLSPARRRVNASLNDASVCDKAASRSAIRDRSILPGDLRPRVNDRL